MTIFIAPDQTQYPPMPPDTRTCPALEPLTGADMVISPFPLPVSETTLARHIAEWALFVQIKVGYDICSFDALKNASARIQQAKIPMPRAILLFVGRDWQDDDSLLRIENSKPYGDTTYKTFVKLKAKWRARGGVVDWLPSMDMLPMWIEAQQEVIGDIQREGKREVYPKYAPPTFEPDDIWQEVVEVPKDDWRYFLCAGLDGFGPTLANNLYEHMQDELSHLPNIGYYALKVMLDEDEKGKAVHNIKGIGDGLRKKWRIRLGLPDGTNLSVSTQELDYGKAYHSGWYAFAKSFKTEIDNGRGVKDSFNGLMRQANEFFKETDQ